jgi:predicted ArsR family transcriptional regulator
MSEPLLSVASDPRTVPVPTAVGGPPSLRRDLLLHLRVDGPSSPDQLAMRLGASRTGVLQQLRALEDAHLVSRQTVRHGVGRPRHVYDVTADAQDLFPSNYDGLAAGLLAAIESVGGNDLLEQVFAARCRQLGTRVRADMAERVDDDAPLLDRVRELAVIQARNG